MTTARVELPKVLIPVFDGPADVRGAYGGRGSGKTRSFAKMVAVRGYMYGKAGTSGILLCARQFMNSLEDSSLEECKRAIEDEPWLLDYYEIGDKYIKSRDGRITFAFAGLDRNIASIKSKGRLLLCWVDEAEPVTDEAFTTLIPTLREEGDGWNAELWVTWNPKRKSAAVERRFRLTDDPMTKVVKCNWRDNPKFPAKLERDRQKDSKERPEQYDHIWEGGYATVVEGAYFAKDLVQANSEGRISHVAPDPLMTIRLFADLGGTGARADNFVFWAAQFIGKEIRVVNHYEKQGQPISTHLEWLRESGYTPGKAQIWLPHDGDKQDSVYDASFATAFEAAGYEVTVIPNQGKGAAKMRIEAARRLFPSIWFNESTTVGGRDALGWYHEKRDEVRVIGLGPEHDWASHSCFLGSTEILTRYGTRQIMNLPYSGEVLTPCGWKQYIAPRVTRQAAPLVEVVFTGGHSVKCTPDHLFMTESGWKSAESLTPNTAILSTLTRSRNISMAASIGCGRVKSIYRGAVKGFIEMCGLRHSGKYPKIATSTTRTVTCSTTGWKTLSACLPASIYQSPVLGGKSLNAGGLLKLQEIGPQSGMLHQRGGYGTSGMQSALNRGLSGSEKKSHASSAGNCIWHLFEKVATRANTVLRLVKSRLTESAANQTNTLVFIESVKKLSETADVWDITVPDGHWFSLANGAVVHNCDAFGLMCVAYEEPTVTKKLKRKSMGYV